MTNKTIMPKPAVSSHHKNRPVADTSALAAEGFKHYAAVIAELNAELRDLQAAASALCSVLLFEKSESAFSRKIKICIKDLATLLADYDPTPE